MEVSVYVVLNKKVEVVKKKEIVVDNESVWFQNQHQQLLVCLLQAGQTSQIICKFVYKLIMFLTVLI